MKRALIVVAVVLATAYLGFCGYVAAVQDRFIYHPSPDVVAPEDPSISVVLIDTEDGERLRAWSRPTEPGQPTFLYLQGNAGRPEIETGRWRRIAAHGAGFLAVSYRGYSGSTGRPSEAGLHADARAAYDWLIANGVAADDIVIHGFSLGSGVATRLAADRDAKALVLEAPFTSVEDLVLERMPPVAPWRQLLRSRFLSRDRIGAVDEPILIVHGDADSVIPVEHGRRLAMLTTAPTTYVEMAGSDHSTLTRDGLYEHIWSFLDGLGG
jgi:fermentation-respiration switch protein FrsA (DUF1100 family)